MDFKEYLREETSAKGMAEKIEEMIVDYINTGSVKDEFKVYEESIKSIVSYFGFKSPAIHTGKHKGQLNSFYKNAIKELNVDVENVNKTAKSDFLINDRKISLKLNDGLLMAERLNGTQICFNYVLQNNTEINNKIKQQIKQTFDNLRSSEDKVFPVSKKDPTKPIGNEGIKNELTEALISTINENADLLRLEFLKAGMTGKFKYEKDDLAVADSLMIIKTKEVLGTKAIATTLKDSKNIKFDRCKLVDIETDDYIKKLADRANIQFMLFKESKNRSAYGLDYRPGKVIKESIDLINEGIIDVLKGLMSQGWEKVKDKIKQIVQYILDLIDKGIQYLFDFLGIKVIVKIKDEIVF